MTTAQLHNGLPVRFEEIGGAFASILPNGVRTQSGSTTTYTFVAERWPEWPSFTTDMTWLMLPLPRLKPKHAKMRKLGRELRRRRIARLFGPIIAREAL